MPEVADPFKHVVLPNQRVENTLTGIVGDDLPDWVRTFRGKHSDAPVRQGEKVRRLSYNTVDTLPGKYFWGGFVPTHPGHFVGEQASRLLISAKEQPDAKALFVIQGSKRANKTQQPSELPSWFWDICSWYGIEPDRMVFIDEPVVVEELVVYPQAEYLPNGAPSEAYLDALDENWRSKGLAPIESDILYVSRAANALRYSGERYLEDLLRANGVTVIRPEELSSEYEKMQYFAGAKHIIINTGSAVLFRNMLGRVPQQFTQLIRSPQSEKTLKFNGYQRAALEPRVSGIDYIDLSRGFIVGPYVEPKPTILGQPPRKNPYQSIKPPPLLSKERTIEYFSTLGVDLKDQWVDHQLAAAEREFLLEFHKWCFERYPQLDRLRITQNIRTSLEANRNGVTPNESVTDVLVPLTELPYLGDIRTGSESLASVDQKRSHLKPKTPATNPEAKLLDAIAKSENYIPLQEIMPRPPFYRLSDTAYRRIPNLDEITDAKLISVKTFGQLPELFTARNTDRDPANVEIFGLKGAGAREISRWVKMDYLTGPGNLEKYKVLIPRNGIGSARIAAPKQAHSSSYFSIGSFGTLKEAENLLKYLATDFVLQLRDAGLANNYTILDAYARLPLQDFTDNSDIDWSQSLAELSQQIGAKYEI